jgi:diamine N-acetyltransferase
MNATLREATTDDAETIARVGSTVWTETYASEGLRPEVSSYLRAEFSRDRVASLLAAKSSHVIVAECNGQIIGYARVTWGNACPNSSSHCAELVNLYILEAFTSKGIGTQLLKESERIAGGLGEQLWLSVEVGNDRAIQFYAHRGYRDVGETYFELGPEKYKNRVFVSDSA